MGLTGKTINSLRDFADFRLDTGSRVLWRGNDMIDLPPRAIDLLCVLTERPGEVVSKEDLFTAVWKGSFVEDSNLTHQIYELRKVFREHGAGDLIQTVPRRGYRFTGEIREAFEGDGEIIVERTVTSRALIAEIESPATMQVRALTPAPRSISRTLMIAAPAIIALILVGAGAVWFFRTPPSSEAPRSVAVIPLQELGESKVDRSVLLGMTYALIAQLGSSGDLAVRPLSSSMSAAASDPDPLAIGKRLGVDSVVEWYLQSSGTRSRVNVRLVQIADGRQLWSESFDFVESDLFQIQDAVSDRTARSLIANLSASDDSRIHQRPTGNNDAYQAYLRGRYHWNQRTREGFDTARGLFEQAISIDPKFAEAHAGLADVHLGLYDYGYVPADQSIPYAIAAANKALELSPNLSEAFSTLASIEFLYNRNWAATEKNYEKAIELAPNDPTPRLRYGWIMSVAGRVEPGLEQLLIAEKLDPTSNIVQANIAYNMIVSGRYSEAEARLLKLKDNAPGFSLTHWYLGTVYFLQNRSEDSLNAYFTAYSIDQGNSEQTAPIKAMIDNGDRTAAFRAWREGLEQLYATSYFPPSNIALVAALAKDRDRTIQWLREAERVRDPWILQVLHDPEYGFLKGDPLFDEIAGKLKFN